MTAASSPLVPQPPIAVLSRGPRRLSLRYPACRDRPTFARSLEAALSALPGIEAATVNPLTARVRLELDWGRLNPTALGEVLQLREQLEPCDLNRPASAGRRTWLLHPAIGASIIIGLLEKALFGLALLTANPTLAVIAGVVMLLHHASMILVAIGWLRSVVLRSRAALAPPNHGTGSGRTL
jgi:hypothetical protein